MNTRPPASPPQPRPPRPRRGWMTILGAALIAWAAYLLYRRYGAQDVSEAETMVYGMLLFLAGAAGLAFVVVLLLKLFRPRNRPLIGAPEDENDHLR